MSRTLHGLGGLVRLPKHCLFLLVDRDPLPASLSSIAISLFLRPVPAPSAPFSSFSPASPAPLFIRISFRGLFFSRFSVSGPLTKLPPDLPLPVAQYPLSYFSFLSSDRSPFSHSVRLHFFSITFRYRLPLLFPLASLFGRRIFPPVALTFERHL